MTSRIRSESPMKTFDVFEKVVTAVFTAELLINMFACGFPQFFKEVANLFDFFIVIVLWLAELPASTVPNVAVLRVLRVIRVLRLIKGLKAS